MAANKCDECGHFHHPKRAHTFAPLVPVRVKDPEPVGVIASAEAWYDLTCEVCRGRFESRRPHAKTCSAKCRQRKRRAVSPR